MKPLYLLNTIYVVLILSGCASTHVGPQVMKATQQTTVAPAIVPVRESHKDPITVSMITKEKTAHSYKVVAKAKVSKYNKVGIKRQEATIRDIMRKLAASVNGDAVIDVKNQDKDITGTVIVYNQPLGTV